MRPAAMAVLLLTIASCAQPPADGASGAELYGQLCARCHGPELGGGIGPPLGPGSDAEDAPDEQLVTTILRGRGRMPSFNRVLTDEQVVRLVDFIRREQAAS